MLNGRSKGNWKSRRSRQSKDERKGGRTVKTAASAFFCVYGIIASSEGPSAWRQACALPRCESRYFHTDRKKPIIRTHFLSETSSDYIGLVPVVGLEPTRGISPTDFESVTSANSITPARIGYYTILPGRRQYPGRGFCGAEGAGRKRTEKGRSSAREGTPVSGSAHADCAAGGETARVTPPFPPPRGP